MEERNIHVDHSTVHRWVASRARPCIVQAPLRGATGPSCWAGARLVSAEPSLIEERDAEFAIVMVGAIGDAVRRRNVVSGASSISGVTSRCFD